MASPRQIRSTEEARARLEELGVMTLVRPKGGGAPSLVDEIAGEEVKGSWWAHQHGKEIFRIANELEELPDVLVTKLGGRVVFVHGRLFGSLLRTITSKEFVARRKRVLSPEAKTLLARVEREGRVLPPAGKAKTELSTSNLVRVAEEHTSSGKHATVFESWTKWTAAHSSLAVDGADPAEALSCLLRAGIELA